ncbi:MAG: hypothetical protein IPL32_19795 [Chloracidobacterium sp.]|nr:hypothetical protein [Chloracidobacterium sp.]
MTGRQRGRPALVYHPGDVVEIEGTGIVGRYRKPVKGSWGRSLLLETELGLMAVRRVGKVIVRDPNQTFLDLEPF